MGDKCVYSCTSRVHRKPKCDTHGHFFLILGNITILTTLSTPGRSLPEYADYENHCYQVQFCVKVEFWAFHYEVNAKKRSFLSFNMSKFNTDKSSYKALLKHC